MHTKSVISVIAALFAVALGVFLATPAHAAVGNGEPTNQIGMLVPYTASVSGPYNPYIVGRGQAPVQIIVTTNGGCTWTVDPTPPVIGRTPVPAGGLDGVVYSFTTRSFGIEQSTNGLAYNYTGADASTLCPSV